MHGTVFVAPGLHPFFGMQSEQFSQLSPAEGWQPPVQGWVDGHSAWQSEMQVEQVSPGSQTPSKLQAPAQAPQSSGHV